MISSFALMMNATHDGGNRGGAARSMLRASMASRDSLSCRTALSCFSRVELLREDVIGPFRAGDGEGAFASSPRWRTGALTPRQARLVVRSLPSESMVPGGRVDMYADMEGWSRR